MVNQDELRVLLRETVREMVAEELQALLFLEREAFIQENGGRKNGTYPRKLETPFGEINLRVPRDRQGRFRPSLFAPYARRTVDLSDLVLVLYAVGVSDRKVGEVMSYLLGHRYSHTTVSRITELVLERVEEFRKRPLRKRYAVVYLDALFVKVLRQGSGIRKEAVYVVLGITPEGKREVLGFYLFPTESAAVWQEAVLKDLWERGLREVLVFVTDDLPGIEEAIRRVYPEADWQQCVVHKVRSTLSKVRKEDQGAVIQDLKRVYRAESHREAHAAWQAFVRRWGGRYPQVVRSWEEDLESLLCFLRYPKALWAYLRSTNLLERFMRELRRGTKVRDHQFPKPEAVYKLVYLECERQEGKWGRKLKGFAEAQEQLEQMFAQRYPAPQNVTQKS